MAEIIASTQPTPTVLPEHLLLAILFDPTCDSANVLRALDVDEFALGQRLRKSLTTAQLSPPAPEVSVESTLLAEISTAALRKQSKNGSITLGVTQLVGATETFRVSQTLKVWARA